MGEGLESEREFPPADSGQGKDSRTAGPGGLPYSFEVFVDKGGLHISDISSEDMGQLASIVTAELPLRT